MSAGEPGGVSPGATLSGVNLIRLPLWLRTFRARQALLLTLALNGRESISGGNSLHLFDLLR
jgi:hypothetical protein